SGRDTRILASPGSESHRSWTRSFRPVGEWRATHGSSALSESCGTRVHRTVGFDSTCAGDESRSIMAGIRLYMGTSWRGSGRWMKQQFRSRHPSKRSLTRRCDSMGIRRKVAIGSAVMAGTGFACAGALALGATAVYKLRADRLRGKVVLITGG